MRDLRKFRILVFVAAVLWMAALMQILMTRFWINQNAFTQAFARNRITVLKEETRKENQDLRNRAEGNRCVVGELDGKLDSGEREKLVAELFKTLGGGIVLSPTQTLWGDTYVAYGYTIGIKNRKKVNGRAINHTAYLLENVDGSGQTAPRYTFYTGEEIGIIPEVGNTYHLQLTWKNNVVTYYVNGHKLGSQDARMGRTFIMQVEGSCKHDGDTIDATFDNVKVAVGDSEVTWGTYQDWGTIEENFGLKIRTTKDGVAVDSGPSFTSGETSYGQCFEIYGRASVPAGVDWDSAEKKTGRVLSALAMLPQNGEKARQEEEAAKNNGGKPSGSDTGSSTSSDSGSSSTSSGSGGTEQPSAGGETGGGTSSGSGTSTESGGGTSAGSGSVSTSSGSGSGSTSSGSGTGSATSGSGTTENPSSAGDSTGGSEDTAA